MNVELLMSTGNCLVRPSPTHTPGQGEALPLQHFPRPKSARRAAFTVPGLWNKTGAVFAQPTVFHSRSGGQRLATESKPHGVERKALTSVLPGGQKCRTEDVAIVMHQQLD
jgi:hypothetical protein